MATSHFHQIPTMLRYVEMLSPGSILDIGAGTGKWGVLCRDRLEYLEGRIGRASWVTRIYGIELHEGYKNPVWEHCYDGFWVGDALDVLGEVPDVELVLLGDVLSFMTKERGWELLARLAKKSRYLLIATPAQLPEGSNGKHDDNPATVNHLSHWAPADFADYWFVTERQGNTVFFLIDLRKSGRASSAVEAAERYPLRALLRAVRLKILRKLRLPTGRFAAPQAVREQLAADIRPVGAAEHGVERHGCGRACREGTDGALT